MQKLTEQQKRDLKEVFSQMLYQINSWGLPSSFIIEISTPRGSSLKVEIQKDKEDGYTGPLKYL